MKYIGDPRRDGRQLGNIERVADDRNRREIQFVESDVKLAPDMGAGGRPPKSNQGPARLLFQ